MLPYNLALTFITPFHNLSWINSYCFYFSITADIEVIVTSVLCILPFILVLLCKTLNTDSNLLICSFMSMLRAFWRPSFFWILLYYSLALVLQPFLSKEKFSLWILVTKILSPVTNLRYSKMNPLALYSPHQETVKKYPSLKDKHGQLVR